jgi:hypothetical protein
MKRRPKLHLVGQDPADIFKDLDQLRADLTSPPQRRKRLTETFARIPHDKALALHALSGMAWIVLIELDRLILKAGGRNPVKLSSRRLREIGLTHHTRLKALRQLEKAGVIIVGRRGRGHSPWVLHSWYPRQD